MSKLNIGRIQNENEDGSASVSGISTFSSTAFLETPKGTTAQRPDNPQPGMIRFNTDSGHLEYYTGDFWDEVLVENNTLDGGNRGIFAGGNDDATPGLYDSIDYITISSLGNAINFGSLQAATTGGAMCASSTRGLFMGGGQGPAKSSGISFFTFSSTGNASSFGNLTSATDFASGFSNSTRGLICGGRNPAGTNVIEYVTIASTGNSVDFGDLQSTRSFYSMSFASSTRGISGGEAPAFTNLIDYVTISTTGNASDFGDLTDNKGGAGCSNSTRGLFGGAYNPGLSNSITFITIASKGDSQDFGDLTQTRRGLGACASSTRGLFGGGMNPSPTNTDFNIIDYVTILSTGNAIDFGDLVTGSSGKQRNKAGCSNGHGGL